MFLYSNTPDSNGQLLFRNLIMIHSLESGVLKQRNKTCRTLIEFDITTHKCKTIFFFTNKCYFWTNARIHCSFVHHVSWKTHFEFNLEMGSMNIFTYVKQKLWVKRMCEFVLVKLAKDSSSFDYVWYFFVLTCSIKLKQWVIETFLVLIMCNDFLL